MYVNTDGLRTGGKGSYNAADHSHESAGRLSRTAVTSSMFGNFSEAKAFGQRVVDTQSHNVGLINCHTENLGNIGDKARCAAADFDEMERENEARIRALRESL